MPWHRGCAATGQCHGIGKRGSVLGTPREAGMGWLAGGSVHGAAQCHHPSKFHLCPVKCQLGAGESRQGNAGRESLGFRGGQEVAGDKGLSNDWHGGRAVGRHPGAEGGNRERGRDGGKGGG